MTKYKIFSIISPILRGIYMEWLEQSLDSLVRLKTKFGANGINYVDKQRGILIKRFNSLLQILPTISAPTST